LPPCNSEDAKTVRKQQCVAPLKCVAVCWYQCMCVCVCVCVCVNVSGRTKERGSIHRGKPGDVSRGFLTPFPFLETATHCNTLQQIAAHCSTLQHTATRCSALQHKRILDTVFRFLRLQHSAAHCTALHRTASQESSWRHFCSREFEFVSHDKRVCDAISSQESWWVMTRELVAPFLCLRSGHIWVSRIT